MMWARQYSVFRPNGRTCRCFTTVADDSIQKLEQSWMCLCMKAALGTDCSDGLQSALTQQWFNVQPKQSWINQSIKQTAPCWDTGLQSLMRPKKQEKRRMQFSTMYVKDFRLLCHTFQQKRFNSFINTVWNTTGNICSPELRVMGEHESLQ